MTCLSCFFPFIHRIVKQKQKFTTQLLQSSSELTCYPISQFSFFQFDYQHRLFLVSSSSVNYSEQYGIYAQFCYRLHILSEIKFYYGATL